MVEGRAQEDGQSRDRLRTCLSLALLRASPVLFTTLGFRFRASRDGHELVLNVRRVAYFVVSLFRSTLCLVLGFMVLTLLFSSLLVYPRQLILIGSHYRFAFSLLIHDPCHSLTYHLRTLSLRVAFA